MLMQWSITNPGMGSMVSDSLLGLSAEQGILRSAEFTALQWEEECTAAPLADVLRVHDWNYIKHLQAKCNAIPAQEAAIGRLDMDTAISHASFAAALVAAGAVCRAIDAVVNQQVSMLVTLLAPACSSLHNQLHFFLSVASCIRKQLSAHLLAQSMQGSSRAAVYRSWQEQCCTGISSCMATPKAADGGFNANGCPRALRWSLTEDRFVRTLAC